MTRKQWKALGISVAVVLAIIVVLQNTESQVTKILFFAIEMPRAVLLFVNLAVGFALGLLFSSRIGRKPPAARPPAEPSRA